MAPSAVKNGESQIYNWNIKKEAALGGGSPGNKSTATDTSSAMASNNKIPQDDNVVKIGDAGFDANTVGAAQSNPNSYS